MRIMLLFTLFLVVGLAVGAALPAGVTLPLAIWDVNFNQEMPGLPPRPLTKAQIEAAGQDDWKKLPLRTFTAIEFITRTRTARVEKAALGFTDQPLIFTVPDSAQPHWGPRVWFHVPPAVAAQGKRYHLSLDVAMARIAHMGGIHIWDISEIVFSQDGTIKVGVTELGRYLPNTPVHLDVEIDADAKTMRVTLNGKTAQRVTTKWQQAKAANFNAILLNGLLPGGRCQPGQIAFDNIRLELIEARL